MSTSSPQNNKARTHQVCVRVTGVGVEVGTVWLTFESGCTAGSHLDVAVGPTEPAVPTEAAGVEHVHAQRLPCVGTHGGGQHGEEQEAQVQLHLSSVMLGRRGATAMSSDEGKMMGVKIR